MIDKSPAGLIDSLCRRFESVLTSFWPLPGEQEFKDSEPRPPFVHAQYLPISSTANAERNPTKDYPIVVVECVKGKVSDFDPARMGSEITIRIHFGGYSEDTDNQGWSIPTNMMWRVMQDLCSRKMQGGYIIDTDMDWISINSREPPYYTAMLETVWRGSPPAVEAVSDGVIANDRAGTLG